MSAPSMRKITLGKAHEGISGNCGPQNLRPEISSRKEGGDDKNNTVHHLVGNLK